MRSSNTMHNPQYAQRVWARFRHARAGGRRVPASDPTAHAVEYGKRIKDELAAVCMKGLKTQHNQRQECEGESLMIKLNCGVSRKVGQPNYGSRGASVNVELELESSAAQDTNLLHEKIRGLFAIAKSAVDQELDGPDSGGGQEGQSEPPSANGHGGSNGNGGGDSNCNGAASHGNSRRAITDNQSRAIWAICDSRSLDQDAEAAKMFNRPVEQLSLSEASRLIDSLKKRTPSTGGQ